MNRSGGNVGSGGERLRRRSVIGSVRLQTTFANRRANMFRYAVTFVAILAIGICLFALRPAEAEDTKYLTKAEASKQGIKVELTEYRPKVFNVTIQYATVPKSAELVIRNEKDDWVATVPMAIADKSSSVSLLQEYVTRSYFYVHNTDNTGYQLPVR
jgi:hypothetical protein